MVRDRTLWSTNIRYLNDSAEFEYTTNWVREILARRFFKNDYDSPDTRLLQRAFDMFPETTVFVFSMSEHGDQLSQWRGYCSPYSGFAIGYRRAELEEFAFENGFDLTACLYDTKSQSEQLTSLVDTAYDSFPTHDVSPSDFGSLSPERQVEVEIERARKLGAEEGEIPGEVVTSLAEFWASVMEVAPKFKHPSFREEAEWRLIARDTSTSRGGLEFRAGRRYVVPYITLGPLPKEAIGQVVVGPSPQQDLALRSVSECLDHYELEDAEVIRSTIPYREE